MEKFCIYHRKDGRWEGRISKNIKSGEKRCFYYFLGRSRNQVQKKMEFFKLNNQKNFNTNCSFVLKKIYEEWFKTIVFNLKESTRANYELKWKKHIFPKFGNMKISDITVSDIYNFIAEKQKCGLSNRYISDIIVLMKSIFKYASRQYNVENPLDGIAMPKKKAPEIAVFSDGQKSLKKYLLEHPDLTALAISLAMTTGIRIGELCALKWSDIDIEKRILTVSKTMQRIQTSNSAHRTKLVITEPKSETSKRCIPVPECMVDLLRKFQSSGENYLCSGKEKPVEPRTMQYRFAKVLKNANLPSVHFHALRHMFASECVKLGFDVKALSEILGHSNVRITLEKYVHSDFAIKQEYMKRINFT